MPPIPFPQFSALSTLRPVHAPCRSLCHKARRPRVCVSRRWRSGQPLRLHRLSANNCGHHLCSRPQPARLESCLQPSLWQHRRVAPYTGRVIVELLHATRAAEVHLTGFVEKRIGFAHIATEAVARNYAVLARVGHPYRAASQIRRGKRDRRPQPKVEHARTLVEEEGMRGPAADVGMALNGQQVAELLSKDEWRKCTAPPSPNG